MWKFLFINGVNKVATVVVGKVGENAWFINLSITFSVSFSIAKSILSLPGGFSSFNACS